MKIIYTPKCLGYSTPGHPETPERVSSTADSLFKKGLRFEEPKPCGTSDILRVHSNDLIESLKNGSFWDGDTPTFPNIIDHAMLSAGAAVHACECAGRGETAFSLMRPPGHHATRNRAMGFCYLNSIAVATAKYLSEHPRAKTVILDIDCHHGNGTEDIFIGNSSVLYISLHQSPLYPGTGLKSIQNCLNFPLPPKTGEVEYLKTLETALEAIIDFNPDLIGVSAGFDTFKNDPIANLDLNLTTYRKIGKMIFSLNKPAFAVLEGGYHSKLPDCVYEFLNGLDNSNDCSIII